MSQTSIVLPCTHQTKGRARQAAGGSSLAEWCLAWINTGIQLSPEPAPGLPRYLIADDPETGELYAIHTARPRCLIRLVETNRGGYIAQPVETYEPATLSSDQLSQILTGAEDAAAQATQE